MSMFWKLLLTAAVILGAYLVIRARIEGERRVRPQEPAPTPVVAPGLIRTVAIGVVGLMLAGSAFFLYHGWQTDHAVVRVEVVNANTGEVTPYLARRGAIDGRRFRTLDGVEVRLADVERMIVTAPR